MALNCPDCGERVQNLMAHVCKSNKGKQDATDTNRSANQVRDNDPKRRDARLPVQRTDPAKSLPKVGAGAKLSGSSGQEPIIAASSVKRGRPRIGETRDKPWIAAGMSERTWYRRKKEKAK